MFRDLNKINGASVFTLNLRPGVIIYQLVMSHLYPESVGGALARVHCWYPGPPSRQIPRHTWLHGSQGLMDSKCRPSAAFYPRLLIIKTVFCPNLKFRQLLKLTLPTPREPQELTASDQIRDDRDNVMKQRDTAWLRGLVTKQCHWPSSSSCHLEEKELLFC